MAKPGERRTLRTLAGASVAFTRIAVAMVVFAVASQVGHTYVFCRVMQAVIPHACCSSSASIDTHRPALAVAASDCCQTRNAASLGASTPTARTTELAAPSPVAIWMPSPRDPSVVSSTDELLPDRAPAMRTGPPKTRIHVQLMVFHV